MHESFERVMLPFDMGQTAGEKQIEQSYHFGFRVALLDALQVDQN
jgi:hypothetical protein